MIKTQEEAKLGYAELWAWATISAVFLRGVVTGKYPNSPELAVSILRDWDGKVGVLAKEVADWFSINGVDG